MKQLIPIFLILIISSCTVFKPKATPTTTPTPTTQEKVPDVMSRSITKIPIPTIPSRSIQDAIILRDTVLKMALRMDTMLYKNRIEVRDLVKYKEDSRGIIDSLVKGNEKNQRELSSLKKAVEKMQWIDFNGNDFIVTVVNDTTVGVSIKARPLPQPVGRKEAEPTLRWLYTQSIQYPIYND